jgi:thiol:disulfide interchange protein DsbD
MATYIRLLLILWSVFCIAAPAPQNQAFVFAAKQRDANTIRLHWTIKTNYFLYQQPIRVDTHNHKHLHLGTFSYPEPEMKINQQGQQVLVYRDNLQIDVPILSDRGGEYLIAVHYQGCSDEGFCYPPQTRTLKLSFTPDAGLTQVTPETQLAEPISPEPLNPLPLAPSTQAQTLLSNAHPIGVILSFFGFGLLLAFTPCVLPMIPVLSGIIVGHGHKVTTRKAFLLSLSYVLSMSATYGIIGALIASMGANLQMMMQSPWIISSFSILFILLSLSMFDIYTFQLPTSWQAKFAQMTRTQASGHYLSAAIMGAMSILILSPCVTPPLIGALSYIAETHSAFRGLLALFFLGLGMGSPLLVIGASAGKLLPKAGMWMNTIKRFFGVLLLGLAIHLLSRLIAPFFIMVAWSTLLIFSGFGLKPFTTPATKHSILLQVIGLMAIAYGVFILFGASAGHTNPLQPLAVSSTATPAETPTHTVVKTLSGALAALDQAKQNHQPVMVDFYASWCDACQKIEKTTLHEPRILALQEHIQILKIDLSDNNLETQALLKYFKVIAPPTFLFYDALGNRLYDLNWEGMLDTDNLLIRLQHTMSANT